MREVGEFRIKGDPEKTGVINRRDKRAPNSKLGVWVDGIIIIEANANCFVPREPEVNLKFVNAKFRSKRDQFSYCNLICTKILVQNFWNT